MHEAFLTAALLASGLLGAGVPPEPLPPGRPVPLEQHSSPAPATEPAATAADGFNWPTLPGMSAVAHVERRYRTGPMPGMFPKPVYPCCQSYLSYRANFLGCNYDYLRNFDYPWHPSVGCLPASALVAPPPAPPSPLAAPLARLAPRHGEQRK